MNEDLVRVNVFEETIKDLKEKLQTAIEEFTKSEDTFWEACLNDEVDDYIRHLRKTMHFNEGKVAGLKNALELIEKKIDSFVE